MNSYKAGAIFCVIVCVLLWMPNIVFQIASPFWLLTFVFGLIGVGFAVGAKSLLLIIANIIMFLSFFIFMFLGYIIVWLTGGSP